MTSVESWLGGGAKRFAKTIAWGDHPVGTTIGGIIVEEPTLTEQTDFESKETRYFEQKDGTKEAMMQMMLTVYTGQPNPAVDDDDSKRTFAIRGGWKYESSKKGLVLELQRLGLPAPRVGDHVALTRIENRKGAGFQGRTHQFVVDYTKVEDFTDDMVKLAIAANGGEAEAPKKRAPRKAAPVANPTWED